MTGQPIADQEVALLAQIAGTLRADYEGEDMAWAGSPFAWIKTRPSRQVGKIGEQLVAGWCAAKGLNVVRSPDSDCDRVIEDLRCEIKFSTLWRNGGYVFQQFRDQEYDVVVCLGVSPFDAHCWVIPKTAVDWVGRNLQEGFQGQHGGRRGSDTLWLQVNPQNPHLWLGAYGGHLRDGFSRLVEFARRT